MQVLNINKDTQNNILERFKEYITTMMPNKERYELIKRLESEIIGFSIKVRQNKLSSEELSSLALYIASVRNLVHSARAMKSIRFDLADLVRVDNEESYRNRDELIKINKGLYTKVINILSSTNKEHTLDQLAQLESINEYTHDKLVVYVYDQYSGEVSTPLNVIREIYSSNKALINAMKEFKLDIEKLVTFEDLATMVR